MAQYNEKQRNEIVDNICFRIMKGESVRNILEEKDMPNRDTFYDWLNKYKDISDRYARACTIRAEYIFEEMIDIADDGTNDYMTIKKGNEEYNVEDKEVTSRSKLRIDTRKWWLSRVNPKKFGEKLDLTSKDEKIEGATVINVNIEPPIEE